MTFRRSDLQEAFFVPGTHPFRVWGYGTTDPLAEVLAPGYFALGSALLRPGELIYVSVAARQGNGAERAAAHLALVMVRADARSPRSGPMARSVSSTTSAVRAILLARFIYPHQRRQAPRRAPVKRGRGRPPGSRTRKPPAIPTGNSLEPSPQA